MRVAVVGAGISGMSCALRLSERGHRVELLAAAPPLRTTSAVAAALWYPYRALPQAAVARWAAVGFSVLAGLAGDAGSGVSMRAGRELFTAAAPDPWWRDAVPDVQRVATADLPAGFVDGYALTVPVVDMSVHLPWLLDRLTSHGAQLRIETLTSLEDAAPQADVVVNCTGLGARALVGDSSLQAVRGQVVIVEQVGITQWLLVQSDPVALTYVVPRESTVVLGGIAQEGSEELHPDPETGLQMLDRCRALVPKLAEARVLEHKVGLRPARPAVRLEAGRLHSDQRVVHDYGHGGAGVTLAYGCALDVADLVEAG